jgi:ATP adenylyltransferase
MGIKKVKSASLKVSSVRLDEQVWPIERDIFFRPARMKYVRKLIKPQGCVFCTSAEKPATQKTLCVYKTQYSQVVVNKYPYNSGHVLVLPLRHIGDIMQLSIEEYSDLHLTLKLAIKVIQSVYQPHGFNLGMNHGVTGGAGIPDHLHYHIVPRWNGDLNFFPLIAETKLVIETAESTFKKLNKEFVRLNKESRIKNKLTKKEKL